MPTSDPFEDELELDLPRGHDPERRVVGGTRGLFARWLKAEDLTGQQWAPEGGMQLGRRGGKVVGWNDNRHLLTIAGSRAGKGVSLIIPNLIFYPGSALVIDPKGELARVTALRRGDGVPNGKGGLKQKVRVLDPFGVSGIPTATFNPLSELKIGSEDVIEDVTTLADALIVPPESGEKHWTESAQAVLRALILVALADTCEEKRNLLTVRDLLMLTDTRLAIGTGFAGLPDDAFPSMRKDGDKKKISGAEGALIELLRKQEGDWAHVCKGVAEQLASMGDNERGSVLSTARTQTQWLDSSRMKAILKKSNFELADLKRENTTIYLCLPATRMALYDRWLRLIILLALSMMEREPAEPEHAVLFLLDEFNVLGHLRQISVAAGLMAGFGVKLWPIVQNVGQLKENYPKSWETFFANAGVVTAHGVSDHETLKTLSDYLGRLAILQRYESMGGTVDAMQHGSSGLQDDRRDVPLLAEHELRLAFGRGKGRLLVFNVEESPLVVQRFVYHAKSGPDFEHFAGLYTPDPKFRGKA